MTEHPTIGKHGIVGLAIVYKETRGPRNGPWTVCWRWSECNRDLIPIGHPSAAHSSRDGAVRDANSLCLYVVQAVQHTELVETA